MANPNLISEDPPLVPAVIGEGLGPPRRRRGLRVPIFLALILALGVIVGGPATAVYLLIARGQANTLALLIDRNERIMASLGERVRLHLDPVQSMNEHVARLIALGDVDPGERTGLARTLSAALAAAPQVVAVTFVRPDLTALRVDRSPWGPTINDVDLSSLPNSSQRFNQMREADRSYWGELVWSDYFNAPLLNLRTPVRRADTFLGVLVAVVTINDLSRVLAEPTLGAGANAFILYDGEHVLAHPALVDGKIKLSSAAPLPRLGELGDPVLAALASADDPQSRLSRLIIEGTLTQTLLRELGHTVNANGEPYIVVLRELPGYGERPWLIGRYLRQAEVVADIETLRRAVFAAIGFVVLALVVAFVLTRSIGRPIRVLAEVAAEIRELRLTAATPTPSSWLKELDQAGSTFDAMRQALAWFETYVPRRLVRRLMARGAARGVPSEERALTVMFTDITGFTSLAERLSAPETAGFLNHHFTLLAELVEDEGGIIDKFLGDGLMAVWGLAETGIDHAGAACRAAVAMAERLKADNRQRRKQGLAPVRLRIGIHTGRVIVGNIGAPGRIDYTVVGDSVNVAARLMDLAQRFLDPSEECVCLVSAETLAAAAAAPPATAVASLPLRGRVSPVEAFRLALPAALSQPAADPLARAPAG